MSEYTVHWHRVLLFGMMLTVLATYVFQAALFELGGLNSGPYNVLLSLSIAWAMVVAAAVIGHFRWRTLLPIDRLLVVVADLIAVGGGIVLALVWYLRINPPSFRF